MGVECTWMLLNFLRQFVILIVFPGNPVTLSGDTQRKESESVCLPDQGVSSPCHHRQPRQRILSCLRHSKVGVFLTAGHGFSGIDCLIPDSQCHVCWLPGDARSQGINRHNIDPVCLEYSSIHTRMVNPLLPGRCIKILKNFISNDNFCQQFLQFFCEIAPEWMPITNQHWFS